MPNRSQRHKLEIHGGPLGEAPPVEPAGEWVTVFDKTAEFVASAAHENGWGGYSLAATIPLALFSETGGSKIRVTLNSGTQPIVSSAVWLGNCAGSWCSFNGDQVQLKVGGATTFNIPANTDVVSDEINFTKDAVNSLAVSWQFTDGAGNCDMKTIAVSLVPNGKVYFAAGALAGTENKSSFNVESSSWRMISKVELFVS